jgi:hypothetical protein
MFSVERLGVAAHRLEDNAEQLVFQADSAFNKLEDALEANKVQLPKHERETFNDKFIFVLLLTVGTPCMTSLLLSSSPTLTYWIGRSGSVIAFLCFIWMLVGHQVLVTAGSGGLHRRLAVTSLFVVPNILLVLVNNSNKGVAIDVHTQLSVDDCVVYPKKVQLERAWQAANELLDKCIADHAGLTGSSLEELQLIGGVHRCPGYEQGYKIWGTEWDYLKLLELESFCGGWCTSQRPIWHARSGEEFRPNDRCSLVVAEAVKSQLYRIKQIIFSCLITCGVLGFGLMIVDI